MRAVRDHGTPLGQRPARLEGVAALGLDETSFLKATPTASTRYVTALDLWRGYANALATPLARAIAVVDYFHAIKLANRPLDETRCRVQQVTLGHRGRIHDPPYCIRKLLLNAAEQRTMRGRARLRAGLTAGDPTGEVAAWQAKELLRVVYRSAGHLADSPNRKTAKAFRTLGGVEPTMGAPPYVPPVGSPLAHYTARGTEVYPRPARSA